MSARTVLLTGGSGYLGGFIDRELSARGDRVVHLARRRPAGCDDWQAFDLATPPATLPAADALVHAAFAHLPGRYRGGEGDDPDGFLARNRDGSAALFDAAEVAGIPRIVFLSTRAVYGDHPPGTALTEDLTPRPDTLYGQMKLAVEIDLAARAARGIMPAILRITGVYGQSAPRAWHKWADLFADFAAGRDIAPRMGTEVHGKDMAAAVRIMLDTPAEQMGQPIFNVSDLLLDRHDLLTRYGDLHGVKHPPPPRAPSPGPNRMICDRLRTLGWQPNGMARLEEFLAGL